MDPGAWEEQFMERQRVARLATVNASGRPYIVPIVFALEGKKIFTAIDAKPKRASPHRLQRVRNIQGNPQVAVLFDEYSEDWGRLAWVRIDGVATFVESGSDRETGVKLLSARYPQYTNLPLAGWPVIIVTIQRVIGWRATE